MKKKQKNTLQSQRDFYAALMGDETPCYAIEESTIEELDEAIADCIAMLQYSIDQKDKNEISYWRKLLQENKVQRRMLIA
mgnify:FL=1